MLRFLLGAAIAGAAYYLYRQNRLLGAPGSTTNASDAVDDIEHKPRRSADERLDEGVMETFPASDPVSISQPSETAYERAQRLKRPQ